MKKILLRTGIITIGSLALLKGNIKVYAYEEITKNINNEDEKIDDYLTDEELVEKYARVYEINPEVAKKQFNILTGYSYNPTWKNDAIINGIDYSNRELAILSTVRDIYHNPENYNLTNDEIQGEEYESTKCHEDLIWDYSNIIGVNKEVALAITYFECGPGLASDNYLYNHNPAGLGPFNYYLNFEEGIIEYEFVLKNGYGISLDSDSSVFYGMESSYCGDGSAWADNVSGIYYGICNDYYSYADAYGRIHYNEKEQEKIKEKEKVLGR